MIHVFEDRDLIVDRQDGVIVASQKLFLQYFESHELSCTSAAAHIHFGSVSFAERFDDIVLVVENGVLGALCALLLYHCTSKFLLVCMLCRFLIIQTFYCHVSNELMYKLPNEAAYRG